MIGAKIGSLTVLARSANRGNVPMWKTRCDCGGMAYITHAKFDAAVVHNFGLRCRICVQADHGTHKICSRCHTPKELTDFCTRLGSPDGRRHECKKCHKRSRKVKNPKPDQLSPAKFCLVCYDLTHRIVIRCKSCGQEYKPLPPLVAGEPDPGME